MKQLSRNQIINRKINLLKKIKIKRVYEYFLAIKKDLEKSMWFGDTRKVSFNGIINKIN